MNVGRNTLIVAVAVAGLTLAACGDGNPASPSGSGEVSVEGVLLSEGAVFSASSGTAADGGPITVTVEGTGISATVTGNGTWKLESIPFTEFTLVFTQDGKEIGRIEITAEDGAVVDVLVKIVDAEVVLIKIDFGGDDDDGEGESGVKVNVCHKGKKTLSIDESALPAHLGHGDTQGSCPAG